MTAVHPVTLHRTIDALDDRHLAVLAVLVAADGSLSSAAIAERLDGSGPPSVRGVAGVCVALCGRHLAAPGARVRGVDGLMKATWVATDRGRQVAAMVA